MSCALALRPTRLRTNVDALFLVLCDDRLEDSLGEHALQLLVCEVDEELLERVARESLEAENIEQTDGPLWGGQGYG